MEDKPKTYEELTEMSYYLMHNAIKKGICHERTHILSAIDELIHLTEDCPLYDGEERLWLLSAYRNVRRLISAE